MTDLIAAPLSERIATAIAAKGYAVVTYGPDPATQAPAFAFTVGLAENDQLPELILFGLDTGVLRTVLTHAADLMRRQGAFLNGERTDALLHDLVCQFRTVTPEAIADYFRLASGWHGREDYPALQIVWSDGNGRFPDEFGFAAPLRSLQPQLWVSTRLN